MSGLRMLPGAVVLALLGCGDHSYSAAMEERTKAQEEFLSVLQTVKDPATMQAAAETVAQSFARLAATNERMSKMPPPTMEVKERLARDYLPRLQAAISASLKERERIRELPGGREFLDELDNLK